MVFYWSSLEWLTLVLASVGALYLYLTWNFDFWKRRNVPFEKPNLLFGNYTDVLLAKTTVGERMCNLYNKFEGKPFVGLWRFRRPCLLIRDPEVVKDVLVKNFSSFEENGFRVDPELDPLACRNPFLQTGEAWKNTRQTLTPSFTSAKLKSMLPIMENVAKELVHYIRTTAMPCKDGIEAKDLSSRYTMEMVATCAFGINAGSFNEKPGKLKEMTAKFLQPGFWKNLEFMILTFLPIMGTILKARFIPKDVDEYYRSLVRDVTQQRKINNETRNDYLQFLLNVQKKTLENGNKFTEEDVVGHTITFLTDGYETSAIALSFVLYELALHPDVQEHIYQEVKAARGQGAGTSAIIDIPYIEQVVEETLRLHTPLMTMEKVCTRATVLRAADGTELAVPEGLLVLLPAQAFHMDARFYPEPQRFDPQRFSPERRAEIPKYANLLFGEGPRICLGMRFALQQIKLAVVFIIENFVIKTTPKTPKRIELDPTYFLTAVKGGAWVGFEERKS